MNKVTPVEERLALFLEKSREVHRDKYDYSKVVYTTARDKVEIICPRHGPFYQNACSHSKGFGCKACGHEKNEGNGQGKRKTTEQFILDAKKVHGDTYDYSKSDYTGKDKDIIIICRKHGEFLQKPNYHLTAGTGCRACGYERVNDGFKLTTEEFIKRSRIHYGEKYNYSVSEYKGKTEPIDIFCVEHGKFTVSMAQHHYTGRSECPSCANRKTSLQEESLAAFVRDLGLEIETSNRTLIAPLEVDIVIPSLKIAIEYNGLYWHASDKKPANYHLDKQSKCAEKGYRLISIFEDEWTLNRLIVEKKLKSLLGFSSDEVIYARKCEVRTVPSSIAAEFLKINHLQGSCPSSERYGLFYQSNLVSLMTFGTNRFTAKAEIELLRYATSHRVIGGFSKLLKAYLTDNKEVSSVGSYSDKRWSTGKTYTSTGFSHAGTSKPGYFYFGRDLVRHNRVSFQKHKLSDKLKKFDPNLTEEENMKANGYLRIHDCGMDKWSIDRSTLGL